MAMNYEELDENTREYMLAEFEQEEASGTPYRSKNLSALGLAAFAGLMSEAIKSGNEVSLSQALQQTGYWNVSETYIREGVPRTRKINSRQAGERLALTEFSTWYVRGLAKRLLEEGVENCQVYRGQQPTWEPGECAVHEGRVVPVGEIYENHRSRYWPEPGDQTAFSIPFGPSCHHVIRRV